MTGVLTRGDEDRHRGKKLYKHRKQVATSEREEASAAAATCALSVDFCSPGPGGTTSAVQGTHLWYWL